MVRNYSRASSVHRQYKEIGEPESFGKQKYSMLELELRVLVSDVLDKMAEIAAAKRLRANSPEAFKKKYRVLRKVMFMDIYGIKSDCWLEKYIKKGLPYHEDENGIWFDTGEAECWYSGK